MILSDFLSRQKKDDGNPHEIMPISFNMYHVLETIYDDKYLIQTRSQAKSSGINLPEVHGVRRNLDPNLKPKRQHTLPKQGSMERPCVGQEELDQKERNLIPSIMQLTKHPTCHRKSWKNRYRNKKKNYVHTKDLMHSINTANDKMANSNPLIPDGTFHPGPVY